MKHFRAHIFGISAIFSALALHSPAMAENDNISTSEIRELQNLTTEILKSRYVHVLVGLNTANSLQDINNNKNIDFTEQNTSVLNSIDGQYVKGSVWRSKLGQFSAYVTHDGLQRLSENKSVKTITRATDRGDIYDPYGDLKKIQSEIEMYGAATVSIIPSYGKETPTKNTAANEELLQQSKIDHINSWSPGSIKSHDLRPQPEKTIENSISAIDASSSSIHIEIGLEGFYELKNRGDIISARLIDRFTKKSALSDTAPQLDTGAIEEAQKMGYATVIIHLKRVPGYTPLSKSLNKEQFSRQETLIKRTIENIIKKADPDAVKLIQFYGNIASAAVQLKLPALLELYKNPDNRIEKIDLNRPVASTINRRHPQWELTTLTRTSPQPIPSRPT